MEIIFKTIQNFFENGDQKQNENTVIVSMYLMYLIMFILFALNGTAERIGCISEHHVSMGFKLYVEVYLHRV